MCVWLAIYFSRSKMVSNKMCLFRIRTEEASLPFSLFIKILCNKHLDHIMDSYINQVRYWEGKLLSRMKPCLPLWDFLNRVFKPAISLAKECHMTLLQRFSVAQHYQWAFLVSGSPFLSGPPVQCFAWQCSWACCSGLQTQPAHFLPVSVHLSSLKATQRSFSCEDAYCFPNPNKSL